LAPKLKKFKLADIREGITESEVISWCVEIPAQPLTVLVPYGRSVKSRATVQAFDVLCEVQSNKASVEITSPFDGVLKEVLVKEGEIAKVGEVLSSAEYILYTTVVL